MKNEILNIIKKEGYRLDRIKLIEYLEQTSIQRADMFHIKFRGTFISCELLHNGQIAIQFMQKDKINKRRYFPQKTYYIGDNIDLTKFIKITEEIAADFNSRKYNDSYIRECLYKEMSKHSKLTYII